MKTITILALAALAQLQPLTAVPKKDPGEPGVAPAGVAPKKDPGEPGVTPAGVAPKKDPGEPGVAPAARTGERKQSGAIASVIPGYESTEQKGTTTKGGPSHSNLRLKGGAPAPATVTTSFSQQADGTAQITASAPVQLTDAQLPAALDEAAENLAHSIGATPKNGTANPRTLALSGKVQGTSVALDATLNYNSGKLTWSIKLSKLPGQLTIAAAEGMIAGKALTVQPWGAVKATGTAPAK